MYRDFGVNPVNLTKPTACPGRAPRASPDLDSPDLDSPDLDSPDLDSPDLDSPDLRQP